ncbi:MAG: tail protein [Siphoviridae sp. ctCJE6]|nr:MAG: tail protein [Siphoviridae sp. ctCJE6]
MIYRIELRDRDFEYINTLDNRAGNPHWSFSPVGGCAELSLRAHSRYCTELDLAPTFNIRLKRRNPNTKVYDLVYQGRIETVNYGVGEDEEFIDIQAFGYQSALNDIIVNRNYTGQEVSAIVKDILDQDVVPNTDLTYDAGDIENTGFSGNFKLEYTTAKDAIEKLATIAGGIEWGVDANRKVYFKAQSNVEAFHYPMEKKITNFKLNSSSREIINRVIVIGKDVSGSKYVYTKNYSVNQNKYKRRDKIIQNSAVDSDAVAEQLADAEQALGDGIVDRGSFELLEEVILESSIPVGLIKIASREVAYDERNWNTFLLAGQGPFRIRKINYKLNEDSKLSVQVDFGQPLPSIVESINRLKYSIDNVIQSEG